MLVSLKEEGHLRFLNYPILKIHVRKHVRADGYYYSQTSCPGDRNKPCLNYSFNYHIIRFRMFTHNLVKTECKNKSVL